MRTAKLPTAILTPILLMVAMACSQLCALQCAVTACYAAVREAVAESQSESNHCQHGEDRPADLPDEPGDCARHAQLTALLPAPAISNGEEALALAAGLPAAPRMLIEAAVLDDVPRRLPDRSPPRAPFRVLRI